MVSKNVRLVCRRFRGSVASRFAMAAAVLSVDLATSRAQNLLIDQVGYRPSARKFVYSTVAADSFSVIDASTGGAVYTGAFSLLKSNDPVTGLTTVRGDFSALTSTGSFFLRTNAGNQSPTFQIRDTVYAALARASLKAYYYQRCGMNLSISYAGFYLHQPCHLADATFHSTAESTGTIAATGGWHDAGDYGKYVVNAGVSVGTLLMAYEMFPGMFASDHVGIPESGNGVPDILDETRYELEWILKMQSAGGGVFTKLTKLQFESFVMPEVDSGTRYIYQISSTATADAAAMLARAARVYQQFDTTFSGICLRAAVKAWTFLQSHQSIVPSGGFQNPSDCATGVYGDGDDRDERLWAAAELYATTRQNAYRDYYIFHFSDRGLLENAMSWPNVAALAHLTYLTLPADAQASSLVQSLRTSLQTFCDTHVSRHAASGIGLTMVSGDFVWGSNSNDLNNAILLIVGAEVLGVPSYREVAVDQLHYILGVNPMGQSYVTGQGTKRPRFPHHRPSAADQMAEPVPGLLVGGPNQYLNDAVLTARFTSSTPPAACYADDQGSYASNEVAINWNAPLVFVAGYVAATEQSLSVQEREHALPATPMLEQNYPNPFNPTTRIRYRVVQPGLVRLTVSDLLGREIATLVQGEQAPGTYDVSFNASASGVCSGVYFYRLSTGTATETRRLVVVK